jgi:hypothetical protein
MRLHEAACIFVCFRSSTLTSMREQKCLHASKGKGASSKGASTRSKVPPRDQRCLHAIKCFASTRARVGEFQIILSTLIHTIDPITPTHACNPVPPGVDRCRLSLLSIRVLSQERALSRACSLKSVLSQACSLKSVLSQERSLQSISARSSASISAFQGEGNRGHAGGGEHACMENNKGHAQGGGVMHGEFDFPETSAST